MIKITDKDAPIAKTYDLLLGIAGKTRYCILDFLKTNGPARVKDINRHCDLSYSQAGMQLRELKDRGLVTLNRKGTSHYYALTPLYQQLHNLFTNIHHQYEQIKKTGSPAEAVPTNELPIRN